MKKFWCSIILFSGILFQAWSNNELNYPKKEVNGKTYYEYTVQKSEGFYSICKKFGVTEDEIKKVNPGSEKGLTYDMVLLIPYKEAAYYVHKVNRKETLYSISKQYQISIEEIYEANPEIKANGLKAGIELKIPEKKKVSAQTLTVSDTLPKIQKENQPSFSVHNVEKGETLYSISRLYGISVDEIIRLNPDVKDGVKIGKKLIIPPVYSNTAIKSNSVEGRNLKFITHKVEKKETLYSISKQYGVTHEEIVRLNPNLNDGLKAGMILIIPPAFTNTAVEKDDSTCVDSSIVSVSSLDSISDIEKLFVRSKTPKKEINVAIALPFQLSKTAEKTKIDGNTKKFLEFYQGFLIAVDSLRKTGLTYNIYTYDSGKNEAEIKQILEKEELKNMDLLIGPAYTSQIKPMADFALQNNVKLIIPFSSKSDETLLNPNIFQINPPVDKSNYQMAELFIKQFKDKNIVLWRFKNASDDDKKTFADTLSAMLTAKGVAFKTVMFDNIATIRAALVNDKENVVVPMTTSQVALSQALPMVNMLQTDKRKVVLFGFTEWQNYQSISKDLYVLPTYYISPFHIDFTNPELRSYLAKFRHYYNAEPFNSQPQYGLIGYDIAMYFSKAISTQGHDFEFAKDPVSASTLQTKFNFTRLGEKSGFYSTGLYLINHNDKVGMIAIDGLTMQMCPICSEIMKKYEAQQKKK